MTSTSDREQVERREHAESRERAEGRERAENGRGASAIVNVLRILRCFTVEEPSQGVTEIAEKVGLHKSSVSRVLATLEQEQVVEMVGAQDELEVKECEAEPKERDEAQLEAAQPQATHGEQLARLGY